MTNLLATLVWFVATKWWYLRLLKRRQTPLLSKPLPSCHPRELDSLTPKTHVYGLKLLHGGPPHPRSDYRAFAFLYIWNPPTTNVSTLYAQLISVRMIFMDCSTKPSHAVWLGALGLGPNSSQVQSSWGPHTLLGYYLVAIEESILQLRPHGIARINL